VGIGYDGQRHANSHRRRLRPANCLRDSRTSRNSLRIVICAGAERGLECEHAESHLAALTIPEANQAYAQLKADIARAGLFERSTRFYWFLILFAFGGYFAAAAGIFMAGGLPLLVPSCLAFTFFSVQIAGLMHDSGHRAVFASIRNNDILGYCAAALAGMVFDNWKTRHNMHHARPNQEDLDPDMEIPLIATSAECFQKKGALQRWLIRYQAYYYYPLGSVLSFSNRLGTVTYFLRNRSRREAWKAALWLAGVLFLFVAPFAIFSLEKAVLVLLLVHVTSGIYLANCFAPNHKGMPRLARSARLSFLEQQVITARNVRGGLVTDFMLVGLNYQVEHHLFPYTPRNKLKKLRPFVRAACERLGIEYTEVGLLDTNRMLVRELASVARATRVASLPPALAPTD
jgi:fatty acid desaturase